MGKTWVAKEKTKFSQHSDAQTEQCEALCNIKAKRSDDEDNESSFVIRVNLLHP